MHCLGIASASVHCTGSPSLFQFFPQNVSKPKVLVVNDDAASLLALTSLLTYGQAREDYEVQTARSGEEALRAVLNEEFAVILLDVSMPGMDGFETADAIHSHPRTAAVPIIFITAYYADEVYRLKGYQQGAVDYLFTPVIPQVLQAKVAVFVEMAKKNLELQEKTRQLEELNQDLQAQRLRDLQRVNAALQAEIAERRQAEQRAHQLATRDPLTKLPNRRSLIERLEHALAHAARHQESLAVLFLDLDSFKAINDSLGHDIGDALLVQVAARLDAAVRESDMAARLGGDEFVVLLDGLANAEDADKVVRKIAASLALPYEVGHHVLETSASIGVSLYPRNGASPQELIRNADLAMYHAKQQGRGCIQFFHDELHTRLSERTLMGTELQRAIAANEFELLYQPRVETVSGRVTGVEAWLHWRHPRLGLLPEERFMSAADGLLSLQIGEWALNAACEQARRWLDADAAHLPVAVRLQAAQLRAGLPQTVQGLLAAHGLSPSLLQLEVDEAALIRDIDEAASLLREVSDSGVAIALDGFGAGHSSLSLLKQLPLDALKIDRSLARGLSDDPEEAAIIAVMVTTARALSLRVVMDGIETERQLDALKALGCDEYQGSLFSGPLAPDAVPMILPASSQRSADRSNESI